MKKKFGFFKNKRGSGLVEKIMLVAFSVAAGGAVIVYTSNVIIEAKNQNVPGLNLLEDGGGNGGQSATPWYDDDTKTIVLTADMMNSKTFPNLLALCQTHSFQENIGGASFPQLSASTSTKFGAYLQGYNQVQLYYHCSNAPRAVGLDSSGRFCFTLNFMQPGLTYNSFTTSYTATFLDSYYPSFKSAIALDLA